MSTFCRFALWLFSSHPIPIFDFDDFLDFGGIRRNITETKFKGDGTCTTDAINDLRDWLNRPTSGNISVLGK